MQYFLQLIKDALRLDIFDLNFSYNPINLHHLLFTQAGLPQKGIFVRVIAFFWHMGKCFWALLFKRDFYFNENNQTVFYATSQNQQTALQPLMDKIDDACFVGMRGFGEKQFPLFFAYFLSFFFLPLVVYKYFNSSHAVRKSFTYSFDLFWISYGYYMLARWLFRRTKPTTLVVANDHILWTRVLIFAAKHEHVPSIYIQHASVTERFPALAFDYALLEGIDSLEKYAAIGASETIVFLVGVSRFDAFFSAINAKQKAETVGLCTNLFETPDQVRPLAQQLHENLGHLHFVIRPHPRDPRYEEWRTMAHGYGWTFSDGRHENAFTFLSQVDVILAGESNILLEAALLNVFSIYYDFSAQKMDWYGFHNNGLVPYYSEPDQAVALLMQLSQYKPDVRAKTRRYCATVNTIYDGRSTELTIALIEKIVSGNMNTDKGWQSVQIINSLQAYQLPQEGEAATQ